MADQFNLYVGNRLEDLADKLAGTLETPLADPLAAETVVVQNRGTAVFLQQRLSRKLGICANVEFPFLNGFVESIMRDSLPPEATAGLEFFRREVMMFALYRELLALDEDEEAFADYRAYLGNDNTSERARQLAGVLARSFDQYQIFRPEMILGRGPDAPAQRLLWRKLAARGKCRTEVFKAFFELKKAPRLTGEFGRIAVFGISSMPPLYLWSLLKLAEFVPVNFFYLNPCREEWSFAIPPGERRTPAARLTAEPVETLADPDGFSEEFNPLLASFGRLGREFFAAMLEYADYDSFSARHIFHDPAAARRTVLAQLQQDILDGVNRREKIAIPPGDDSLTVVNCHHAMREVEILHDELLRRFGRDPALQVGEVIVMTPDIESYVPYIRAVFGAIPADDPRHIPFSIADRTDDEAATVFSGFFSLYRVLSGRCPADEVIDLLDNPAIRAAFGISSGELGVITRLVAECGTAWGIDAAHRRELLSRAGEVTHPVFAANSWRETRDRLLLGFAVREEDPAEPDLFCGMLPADRIEGGRAAAAEKFELFLGRLFALKELLAVPRPPEAWRQVILELIDDFFADAPAYRAALQELRAGWSQVLKHAALAGLTAPVELPLLLAELENLLAGRDAGGGFMRGGVTFCNLLPMRSIPHKVICILGLDEKRFPRREVRSGLDLLWRHPRRGDRSARLEDRYLFLEALLAAREALYLSYVGQSIATNEALPPSPLLAELLNTVRRSFDFGGGDAPLPCMIKHPLQPFHPDYFRPGGPLISFSPDNFAAARRIAAGAAAHERVFLPGPLAAAGAEAAEAPDFTMLAYFFKNPFAHFCRKVLKMTDGLPDHPEFDGLEPLEPNHLARWKLRRELLAALVGRRGLEAVLDVRRAAGELPPPPFDRFFAEELSGEAVEALTRPMAELDGRSAADFFDDEGLTALPPAWRTRDMVASGRRGRVLAVLLAGKPDGRAAVLGRLLQLCAGSSSEFGAGLSRICLCCTGRVLSFDALLPLPAERAFRTLLELYAEGQTMPLPFMPRTSWQLFRDASIRPEWEGYGEHPGERDAIAVKLFAPTDLAASPELELWRRTARRFFAGDGGENG